MLRKERVAQVKPDGQRVRDLQPEVVINVTRFQQARAGVEIAVEERKESSYVSRI